MAKLIAAKRTTPAIAPVAAPVSYQNIPRQRNQDKQPSLQEHQVQEYSLSEERLEHDILALREVKRPDEVDWNGNPKCYPYHRLISHLIEDSS